MNKKQRLRQTMMKDIERERNNSNKKLIKDFDFEKLTLQSDF